MLINVKMPTVVGILTFMSSWAKNKFYNLRALLFISVSYYDGRLVNIDVSETKLEFCEEDITSIGSSLLIGWFISK